MCIGLVKWQGKGRLTIDLEELLMSVLVRLVQGYSFSSFERKNSAPRYLAYLLLYIPVLLIVSYPFHRRFSVFIKECSYNYVFFYVICFPHYYWHKQNSNKAVQLACRRSDVARGTAALGGGILRSRGIMNILNAKKKSS